MDDRMLENLLCAADRAAGPPPFGADLASAARRLASAARRRDAERRVRRARLSQAGLAAAAYVAGLLTMHLCFATANPDEQPVLAEALAPQPPALVAHESDVPAVASATGVRDPAGDRPQEKNVHQQLRELGDRHLGRHRIREATEYYRLALNIAGPEELAAVSHDTWLFAALKKDRKDISHEIPDIEHHGSDVDAGTGSGG